MNRFAMIVVMAIILAVNTVQAASKYFTCGAGTNAWNTSSSFWGTTSGGPYNTTWSANDDAFFEGTAGGVNLSAVQTANSVTFRIAGYTITNGTLILASPAMISNEVAATISSVIDGSSGMTKAGLGILVLSNNAVANTYVGDTVINGGTLSLVGSAVAGGTNKLASGTI